jgi:hypothetical protein
LSDQADTATPQSACTNACTSNPEQGQADPLAGLAAALLALSPADRARLAALLVSGKTEAHEGR